MLWLYGSKKKGIDPVIRTQNPDLRKLESVVKNRSALAALRNGEHLDSAYQLSLPSNVIFEENLYASQRHLKKAWSFVNEGYDGSGELLKDALSLSKVANDLFKQMKEISDRPLAEEKQSTDT